MTDKENVDDKAFEASVKVFTKWEKFILGKFDFIQRAGQKNNLPKLDKEAFGTIALASILVYMKEDAGMDADKITLLVKNYTDEIIRK